VRIGEPQPVDFLLGAKTSEAGVAKEALEILIDGPPVMWMHGQMITNVTPMPSGRRVMAVRKSSLVRPAPHASFDVPFA